MTKTMESYLKGLEKKYSKKPRVMWLHRWVLTAFAEYASITTYEKALRSQKLSDSTISARLFVVRRYLKAIGKFPKVVVLKKASKPAAKKAA